MPNQDVSGTRSSFVLGRDNPLFKDEIYLRCFASAIRSPCQKMKFGCVITHHAAVVYEGWNNTVEELRALCDPKCVRLSLTSRTEQMIGACGHAEEGLWDVIHRAIPISECELYIAGFYPDRTPWLKNEPEHTCLRCASQMHNAKIKKIYVPVQSRWEGITTERALRTALAYALKQKTISREAN